MNQLVWGLFAAVPAVTAEYLYRTLKGPWLSYLPIWIPLQLAVGYGIYRMLNTPNTNLLEAFVVWSFCVLSMRVFVSQVLLQETVNTGTWVALGLMVLAKLVNVYWR